MVKYIAYTLIFLLLTVISIGGWFVYRFYQNYQNPTPVFKTSFVGGKELLVELAISEKEWILGLSGRSSLPETQGMLFISDQLALPSFWMKDMLIPLDIIWIREGEIIAIDGNIPVPETEETPLSTYHPPKGVDMVLEVNAGWSEKNEIEVGDKIEIINQY